MSVFDLLDSTSNEEIKIEFDLNPIEFIQKRKLIYSGRLELKSPDGAKFSGNFNLYSDCLMYLGDLTAFYTISCGAISSIQEEIAQCQVTSITWKRVEPFEIRQKSRASSFGFRLTGSGEAEDFKVENED
jgi:hypothetical protein